jgi:oligogalacturonide lyase
MICPTQSRLLSVAGLVLKFTCAALVARAADQLPVEWIDPDTGHRVIRLSQEDGSASLYFHQNAYSADGRKLIMTTPRGLSTVDLGTRAIDQVVSGRVSVLVTGRKTGDIYYVRDNSVLATNLDTHATREVARVPSRAEPGGNLTINADETLLVGLGVDPQGKAEPRALPSDDSGGRLGARWAEGRPMMLYTVNLQTGEFRPLLPSHDWLNHLQCSPTDPNLIMFCHEGPWHFNDRVWTIRADGTGLRLMHRRPRILQPRRPDRLVRSADAEERRVLGGRRQSRDG